MAVILMPGIIQPASVRYRALVEALGPGVRALPKELEVYATTAPSPYTISAEVLGIGRFADAHGLDHFHLYGHSGGGACALAYIAEHPDRVLSLALDEPASDFTPDCKLDPLWDTIREAMKLPEPEQMPAFLKPQLAPGVPLPPPPPAEVVPDWFAVRPAGIRTFVRSVMEHDVNPGRYRAFRHPVLFTRGTLSSAFWGRMATRLGRMFGEIQLVLWPGASHVATSHQIDPGGVATALKVLWERAERPNR